MVKIPFIAEPEVPPNATQVTLFGAGAAWATPDSTANKQRNLV